MTHRLHTFLQRGLWGALTITVCSLLPACAQTSPRLAQTPQIPAHPKRPVTPVTLDIPTSDTLARNFVAPPDSTKPRTYWYWMDGHVTKEGITRDLEAMQRVGVGEAYIGIIGGQAGDVGPGGVPALTEEWWRLVEHAIREGGRLGVDIGFFNGPGWSQSGGPWVKPEQSMRRVVFSEMRVRGPQHFEGTLAAPEGALPGQDIATLAFPAPAADSDTIAKHSPKISGGPAVARIFDGDLSTSAAIPSEGNGHVITLEVSQPFTARSLTFYPKNAIRLGGELQVSDDGAKFRSVQKFTVDRHNLDSAVGPDPLAPVSVAFPAAKGRFFRFTFSGGDGLKEITLSGAARIDDFAGKQLSKVFQDTQPSFDFYTWPAQAEPENASFSVSTKTVQNISSRLKGDKLTWDVPAGDWVVQRMTMASTGRHSSPTPQGADGLEVDKMNRVPLRAHFDAYVGKLLKRMPVADRKAFKHVVADSYETGPQNWTDGMAPLFQARFGYDPIPFLPVLSGRLVGSAEQSNRFLWDLRRFIADKVAADYVGGLRDLCHQNGLKMWLENYGHWGFPSEFLRYGGYCDEIGGEFWESGPLGDIELRAASSAAHIYGKPVTYAEAWTGGPVFTSTPWSLKKRGDWTFCQGVNQMVLHVNISQADERRPGINASFGTEFNRHNTWYSESKSWIDYLRRCHYMLQRGNYVADVAYFIGEDTPKMIGTQQPSLPRGYAFDYINADVIENRLKVQDGRFVLPDGMSYRLIVIPNNASMRPQVLQKLRDLVSQGGAVMGEPPTKSPSLQNYPASDQQIKSLADQLWAKCDGTKVTSAAFGKGRVFRGATLQSALTQLKTAPDMAGDLPSELLFLHRHAADADIYFVSNQSETELSFTPTFRVAGRTPELWDPITGQRKSLAVYESAAGATHVPMQLSPRGSMFVVFRKAASASPIVKVLRNNKEIASVVATDETKIAAATNSSTFTVALWVKPTATTTLPKETQSGFSDLYTPRNDIVFPAHGETFGLGKGYAGNGLAVGTNGIIVYEHSGQYFAPILAYPTSINDWTHVAVVYNGGQTSLYLNGKLVHTGLKTAYKVRPGEPNAKFNGSVSDFQRIFRPLSEPEVGQLMQTTKPSDSSNTALAAPLQLARDAKGEVQALVWEPGQYTLQPSNGKPLAFTVPSLMTPQQIGGAWQVSFPPTSGAPNSVTLDKLTSLSAHSAPTVKYFSGTATYSNSFDLPATALGTGRRLYLDLGEVASLAEVTLNGKNLGTLWSAPFALDVSSAAKVGANQLQVRVTNVWHNRLVGQQLAPEAFTAPGVEQTWVSWQSMYGPNEPLFSTGLIGPVTLRQAAVTTAH